MDRSRVPGAQAGHRRRGHRKKAPPGLKVKPRDGFWHIVGTYRVRSHSFRIRKSTGLPARENTWDAAQDERRKIEDRITNQVVYGVRPSVTVSVACDRYLHRERSRPVGGREAAAAQDLDDMFGRRMLDAIELEEWTRFVNERTAGTKPQSRERYIAALLSVLGWCAHQDRAWLPAVPKFERDRAATKVRARRRRRVVELDTDLIWALVNSAAIHVGAQLVVEWSTGARVSSVIYGCRLCDLIIAPGNGADVPNRSQITFHDTKNGEPVVAHLHPAAVPLLERYLKWRGNLRDREGSLFLTDRRKPYTDNGKAWGGQNKTAFRTARRRAVRAVRQRAAREAWALWREGERERAWEALAEGRRRAGLLAQVTQHWFRHLLATTMLTKPGGMKAAMDQGGWLDPRSVMGYSHDVPEHRRQIVESLPIATPVDTRSPADQKKA